MVGLGKGNVWTIPTVAVFSLILLTSLTLPSMAAAQSNQDETALGIAKNKQHLEEQTLLNQNENAAQQPLEAHESACTKVVEEGIRAKGSSLDDQKAISLAMNNDGFKSKTSAYIPTFEVIFTTWAFDPTASSPENCNLKLSTVNVIFSLASSRGFEKKIVVSEDPSLTRVLNITEQLRNGHFGGNQSSNDRRPGGFSSAVSNYWSGYEFAGNANNPPTNTIYEARGTWAVPAVQVPYSGACTSSLPCDAAVWVGLDDTSGANNDHLAQAGTDSYITNCPSSCGTTYEPWFEFLPSGPNFCGGMVFNPGDSVTTYVNKHSGTSTLYDISITDNTLGSACGVTSHNYSTMSAPIYAAFIVERFQFTSGGAYTLAKFSPFNISGTLNYSGSSHSIYTPYSNFWFVQWSMQNGGNTNIGVSSVDSTGKFTESWWTSSGT